MVDAHRIIVKIDKEKSRLESGFFFGGATGIPATAGKTSPGPVAAATALNLSWLERCENNSLVELRGRLSNFSDREKVRYVQDLMDGKYPELPLGGRVATQRERRALEPVRQRLGDDGVAQLVLDFVAGTTRAELVARYGVSLSSVKRLLRSANARRSPP